MQFLFCVPNVVYFYDLRMSILNHFFVASIKSEFGNKQKDEFNDLLRVAIFEIFQTYSKHLRLEDSPIFPYSKHLQGIDPSSVFITKLLSNNKIAETFYEELK